MSPAIRCLTVPRSLLVDPSDTLPACMLRATPAIRQADRTAGAGHVHRWPCWPGRPTRGLDDAFEWPTWLAGGPTPRERCRLQQLRLQSWLACHGWVGSHGGIRYPRASLRYWLPLDHDTLASPDPERPGYQLGLTPLGFVQWLCLNPRLSPPTYAALRQTGLPEAVVDALRAQAGGVACEAAVVAAFVDLMSQPRFGLWQGIRLQVRRALRPKAPKVDTVGTAHGLLRQALADLQPQRWPPELLRCV